MIELNKIIECIYSADFCEEGFYDRQTEELVCFVKENISEQDREKLEQIEDSIGRFVLLPSSYDINKYQIMVNFIEQLPEGKISSDLHDSIHGKGAFRRFKNTLRYYGIEKMWYQFEENAYKEIAIKWCENNGIEYKE